MTTEELVEEIRNTYERAEAQWVGPDYSHNVTAVVFYLSALRDIDRRPFDKPRVGKLVTTFLEEKLDEAFGKLELDEYPQVFRLKEEMG